MKKLFDWVLNLKRNELYFYSGLIIGIGLIISSIFDLKTNPDDLTTIEGNIKRIYNQEKEKLFFKRNYNSEIRVLLELDEYETVFILGAKGNNFSAEKFNYGALEDRKVTLHVKKKDLNKIKSESYYQPYSAYTKSKVLLPLDKTLIERNSSGEERLIAGIIFLFIATLFYILSAPRKNIKVE